MKFLDIDSLYVRLVNRNVAANSERFIMGSDKQQLADIVVSSGSTGYEAGERFSVDVLMSNEMKALVKFSFSPRALFV
jgi:hypothetical protein